MTGDHGGGSELLQAYAYGSPTWGLSVGSSYRRHPPLLLRRSCYDSACSVCNAAAVSVAALCLSLFLTLSLFPSRFCLCGCMYRTAGTGSRAVSVCVAELCYAGMCVCVCVCVYVHAFVCVYASFSDNSLEEAEEGREERRDADNGTEVGAPESGD